ncbi:DEAD/DEAH box helicase [Planomicrobium chinense]|uniref:DEAD/DEAH box helicase n=1 Tax=Planococcus chinensis TaxID=272917 RepID=UPI001CC56C60|nr:DEAD/DEAH box helicase [Planococcus chinensis]MBZ5201573.1 DEAD/DEAH box helicase [Planococcus chinensis]
MKMKLFASRKSLIISEYKVENGNIRFKFFEKVKAQLNPISVPLSDADFRKYYKLEGFDQYAAYEELSETEYMEGLSLPVERYYELIAIEDFKPILTRMGLPVSLKEVKASLKMVGDSGRDPVFSLNLYNDKNELIQYEGKIEYPFYETINDSHYLPKEVWQLHEAIEDSSFSTGYEKMAKIQKIALLNNFEIDDFLKRENYEYIEEISIEPEMLSQDLMKLKIIGESAEITEHLNNNLQNSTIRNGDKRTRIATSKKLREDISIIKSHDVLQGDEIPQFFENPKSLFPDHEFSFDIEAFSERVKGFVVIKKPRPIVREGKLQWFDAETGEEILFDEQALKDEITKSPEKSFYQLNREFIYADSKLKKALGFGNEEEKTDKERMALDIFDNEQALEFDTTAASEKAYEDFSVPANLKASLYDYQREGYSWIASLEKSNTGGLLADDMGLGKTLQVIAFLLHQESQGRLAPSLIILPIALIENWKNEIKKFAPSLADKIYIHLGSHRIKDVEYLKSRPITFISYDTLKLDQLMFGQIKYKNIIADEAQNVKSHGTSRSRAIRAMQGDFRLAMTGTPVENTLEELWSIMDFVEPGAMESLADFRKQFIKNRNDELLMETLKPYYLRRTKKEVLSGKMPDKHLLEPKYLNASQKQSALSEAIVSSLRSKQGMVLNAIMNLRQIYAHPAVLFSEEPVLEDSPKLVELMKVLKTVKKKDEKVLVFTEFRKVQSILRAEITKEFGIHVPIIDGMTKNRADVVEGFNSIAGFGIMILSPKAAGVGLTITSANHVVHYTRWWNPAVENQATDRAYRIGQTKDVYVYQFITQDKRNFPNGTVEEIMHNLLLEKSELAENVIIPFDTASFQNQVLQQIQK